jgi:hypothetical protein
MNVVGMPDEAVKISKRPVKWDLPCRLSSWVGVDEPRGETELHAGDDNRYYLPRKKKKSRTNSIQPVHVTNISIGPITCIASDELLSNLTIYFHSLIRLSAKWIKYQHHRHNRYKKCIGSLETKDAFSSQECQQMVSLTIKFTGTSPTGSTPSEKSQKFINQHQEPRLNVKIPPLN